jgi:PKD domain
MTRRGRPRDITALLTLLALGGAVSCGHRMPTSPSGTFPLGFSVSPKGTGVQYGTTYVFTATAPLPAGAAQVWRFGDGGSANGSGPVTHVYTQAGSFTATLEVSAGGETITEILPITIKSLLGNWIGTVTGHSEVAFGHGPITSFTLTVFTTPNPSDRISSFGSTVAVNGLWIDNAGCRVGTGVPGFPGLLIQELDTSTLFGFDPSVVGVFFDIEQFECNGTGGFLDLGFYGVADATFDAVTGTCPSGGPACRFEMRRVSSSDPRDR